MTVTLTYKTECRRLGVSLSYYSRETHEAIRTPSKNARASLYTSDEEDSK